jgi:hypothetical protein
VCVCVWEKTKKRIKLTPTSNLERGAQELQIPFFFFFFSCFFS